VTSACAARLASRARAGQNDASDDRFSDRPIVIQPVLERRTDGGVDRRQHFGIVEAILRLPLELRLLDEQAENAGQPFANVFRRQRDALGRQVMRLDVIAHGLADARAQSVLVRSAGSCWNAVDIAANVLVGRLGPLEDEVQARRAFAFERKRGVVNGLRPTLRDDLRTYSASPS
jgi:hypothetical protein